MHAQQLQRIEQPSSSPLRPLPLSSSSSSSSPLPPSTSYSSSISTSPPRAKPAFLAPLAIPSLAAFRTQQQQQQQQQQQRQALPQQTPPPVRRKPLPPGSPALAGPQPIGRGAIDTFNAVPSPPWSDEDVLVPRNLDEHPHGSTPLTARSPQRPFSPRTSSLSYARRPSAPRHDRSASSLQAHRPSRLEELRAPPHGHARSPTMPNMPLYASDNTRPPNLTLKLDGVAEHFIEEDHYDVADARDGEVKAAKPKTPVAGSGFTSFFGWNASRQNMADSPSTAFSDKSLSPLASPHFPRPPTSSGKSRPSALDIPASNAVATTQQYFNVPGTPLLSSSPQMNAHVEELERELREVSSELAASIRREMDLEDEVERYRAESTAVSVDNRRTSDYYSDSGASSVRFPIGDAESKLEQVEMLRRKAEQERAQLKVHMAERLQDELRRRRDLEEQLQHLEEQVGPSGGTAAGGSRLQELEASLEDARRRLIEERQVKENFEDLLSALRGQLEQHRNERDNLRDEVVPQLRAQLEGLETEAADTQGLVYETTRMQQEIQQLRNENQTLQNARRIQQEMAQQHVRFQSIAEEGGAPSAMPSRVGLSRSNSLVRSASLNKRGSLQRSNSVKDRSNPESPREGPMVGNPMKEIEEQRDALHKALKHLLRRQAMQQRDFERRIKELEAERDAALNLTPRRTVFHQEVSHLRDEVNTLRRRADDALDQKWRCENGLRGLRMDLDRAEQETSSLRDLLKDHDIVIPEIRIDDQPVSLDKSYQQLRATHALSLIRLKEMAAETSTSAPGEGAHKTLELLKRSISEAEAERDSAQLEAERYRQEARSLQRSEIEHLGKEQKLSSELLAAADRMDMLSERIQQQLESNKTLRKRLAEAVARGEHEQGKSADTIIELERKLKTAEDKVMTAQQSSEEAISRHELEVKTIKESNNGHLRRAKSGLLSPSSPDGRSPSSPVFAVRSPRLSQTTSGPAMSMAEATRTELLNRRVEELERALREADHEMEEVVGRMNAAQMEVADLQFQRDEAMRETRKLQADISSEREKVRTLMAAH